MKPTDNQTSFRAEKDTLQTRNFSAAVLTVSDLLDQGEQEDKSGPAIIERLKAIGIDVKRYQIVPEDYGVIVRILQNWCKPRGELDLIITTGGTGLSPRDVTPEATLAVVDRLIPGIPEAFRAGVLQESPNVILFRGVAGTRGSTFIVNLPDTIQAVHRSLDTTLLAIKYGLEVMDGK